MEKKIQDINKQMLEINYTLKIRQLIKIVQDLPGYRPQFYIRTIVVTGKIESFQYASSTHGKN